METFKLRASASGIAMTNPQKKDALLSATLTTYVDEWLKEQIYGYKKQISSKFLEKGILQEDEAIDKCIEWLDLPLVLKNEKNYIDEYFTGTPDMIVDDMVIDIKNSWDCFTFPLYAKEIPNKDYYYQLQVYMHLTGLKKAKLVYILLNTPATFNQEAMLYDHMDKKYRIKTFDIDYDANVIEELKSKVLKIREYINQLNN